MDTLLDPPITRERTYYKPPPNAHPVLVQTQRPGRLARYHLGARVEDGPLLLPEACNLDVARRVIEVGPWSSAAHIDPFWRRGAACRRCFR